MNLLSILCVLLGILIIATRGPMIFAPAATLRFFDKLISTNAGIRGIAAVLAPFAVALLALPVDDGRMTEVLRFFGWLWAAAALWLFAVPDSYRRLAGGVLDFMASVDESIIRMIGAVAVAIGIALIYFGVFVA